ncbi:glycosyltransferase [Leptolyngbya sp. FACHB-36]|uniref:glycosyltransferase n=1 Tax=Leptolyngbya sp. FACHB-36 TaxID=2692808 RepID=UPI0016805FAD|nr:glycosyltransferase [Leptolyngbya sp. FACHB-36]MBD2020676.1 glycosyltransferase [Leptolyngbya sp. FACHB-36]
MARSFSVIIPLLNQEDEIIRTLESVEASIAFFYRQDDTFSTVESEIVIVNEGSTDRSLERVTEFSRNKANYTIVSHSKSLGAGTARNTGVKVSKGDVLFFCDDDDLFYKEHIFLCFKILTHQSSKFTGNSFTLTTERGSFTIEFPNSTVGIVRTGMYIEDTVHPYWKGAIENCSPLNLCIRRECHEFVEGFPEAQVYKQVGCEDIAYTIWTAKFFKTSKIPIDTVEYIRYPGNNLDRQLQKFQTPPDQYQDDTPPAQKALHVIRQQLEQEKLVYLLGKLSGQSLSSEFAAMLNWKALATEFLNQQNYAAAIALCEQGLLTEPSAEAKALLAVAYNNLGSSLHQQGELSIAADYFQKAIALAPAFSRTDLARVHYNLSKVFKDRREYAQAYESLKTALELDAGFPQAIAELPSAKYSAQIATSGYEFTLDNFSKHVKDWEQYLSQIAQASTLKVLEIGSQEGQTACWLLDNLLIQEAARITCIDAFDELSQSEKFDFNIEKSGSAQKVRKMAGRSHDILRSLIPNSYQLLHLNSKDAASSILESLMLAWRLIQVRGVLVLAAYEGTTDSKASKAAIEAFRGIFHQKVKLLHQSDYMILEKIAE